MPYQQGITVIALIIRIFIDITVAIDEFTTPSV